MSFVAWWVLAGVAAWLVVAAVVGLAVAQVIRLRDRGGPRR